MDSEHLHPVNYAAPGAGEHSLVLLGIFPTAPPQSSLSLSLLVVKVCVPVQDATSTTILPRHLPLKGLWWW